MINSKSIIPYHAFKGSLQTDVPIDSSLAAAVAMAPFDSRFDPRQRRHLIHAQLVYQLIHVQLVLLDWGSSQQNL